MSATRVTIEVDHDGMSAAATVLPGAGDADLDAVRTALADASIVEGLDDGAIATLGEQLAHPSFFAEHVVVAVGRAPEHGQDSRFELAGDARRVAGRARRDGTLDYRERCTIRNVRVGETLGRWFEPTAGRPGYTVCGAAIAADDGAHLDLLGAGVEVDRSSGLIRAVRDGVLIHVPERLLDVTDLFELDGDVDYASGNLEVSGAARIHGDVHPNFTVVATGFVHVDGVVDNARIEAGASVVVEGGSIGRGFAWIRAGGDAHVHHASHVPIEVRGTLELGDHAIDCTIRAADVIAESGRGSLIGGSIHAHTSIRARSAGSHGEIATELAVAIAHDERRAQRRRERRAARDLRNATKRRSADHVQRAKSEREHHRQRADLERNAQRIAERENALLDAASIEILQTAHPGVRIRFGHHVLELTEAHERTRFRFDRTQDRIILEKARP